MHKRICFVLAVTLAFLVFLYLQLTCFKMDKLTVEEALSPIKIKLSNEEIFIPEGFDTFDAEYTDKNEKYCNIFSITPDEAFIIGNLGKYWAQSLLTSREVSKYNNSIIFNRQDYLEKFKNSPFCITNNELSNPKAFHRQLNSVRKGHFVIVDMTKDDAYPVSQENAAKIKNFVVIRNWHYKRVSQVNKIAKSIKNILKPSTVFAHNNIKLILTDETTKIKPDKSCSGDICKELVKNINNAKESIDMAIYGYSSTPAIELAMKNAVSRGVKIRVIYDTDSNGNNIYPETAEFIKLVSESRNDSLSADVNKSMHNKFYIFDKNTVMTGSANLSFTDMSGYNSNSVLIINSPVIAKYYQDEFDQMFEGKFHKDKKSHIKAEKDGIKVYFSPQDKTITNGLVPLIRNAKKYIYILTFIITEKQLTQELINAHNRGVEVKVITDALNASNKYSKHKTLRNTGIQVKTENYAGKMHSKSMIVDDEYIVIGSMNFSKNGEYNNDENLIILHNNQAAKFYRDFFLYQWNKIPDKWLKLNARAEGKDSVGSCSDGIDNNYDGLTDLDDPACK